MRLTQVRPLAFVLCLLLGSWVMYQTIPVSLRDGEWTHTALRNWREYGFFNLHGKLAYNVAGEGLPADVKVYSGHQPTSLYVAGLVTWLTGCKDGLAAHLVFSLLVGLGIWWLLGRGTLGVLAALLSVFSPGYLRFVALLDPVGIPILLAIPLLAWMRGPLGGERLGIGTAGLMAIILALYAALNWTSVCGFAIFGAYLVASLPGKYRRLLLFMLICCLAGGLVLAFSVLSKKGPSAASGAAASGFATLFNNYLFGPGGYAGYPMNWPRAIVRLGANLVVSLLPLWGLVLFVAWRSSRKRTGAGWAWLKPLWPVLVALLFIFGLRNYFAAQPWMAGPVVVCGIAFSLRLMLDAEGTGQSQVSESAAQKFGIRSSTVVAGAFLYGLAILGLIRANTTGQDGLVNLLRSHTDRHDKIYFSAEADPWLAEQLERFSAMTDRLIAPMAGSVEPASGSAAAFSQGFRLTAKAASSDALFVARTQGELSAPVRLMKTMVRWYQAHVVKRMKGDQLELEPTVYLYRLH